MFQALHQLHGLPRSGLTWAGSGGYTVTAENDLRRTGPCRLQTRCAEELTCEAGLILRSAKADSDRIGSSSLQPTDAELVRRIRAGDQGAFRELVNRHSDSLYGLA